MSSVAPSVPGATPTAPAVVAEPTATPAPAAEAKRQIKPIPPKSASADGDGSEGGEAAGLPGVKTRPVREVLPGVTSGGDIELPVRGPDGRFIPRAQAEAEYERELRGAEGGEDVEASPDEPAAPAPEPEVRKPELPSKDVKIKFLNKDVTVAEAEQMFRSLQGMHDPIAKKLAETQRERDYGYQAANAWEQEAKSARAELEQLKAQRGETPKGVPQPGTPEAGVDLSNLDGLVDAIDYDAFELIAHDPQGGTRVAGRYLATQILNTVLNQIVPAIRNELMQQVQPLQETRQQTAVANEVGQVINTVAQYNTLDGQPAFPELLDEATLAEVGAVWHDAQPAGVDPKAWARAAMSPQGLINAIALYRLMKGLPAGPAPVPPPATPAEVEPGAVALAEGGTEQRVGMGRPGRAEANVPPAVRQLRAAFDTGEPLYDKTLGFARNRRG